MRIAQLEIRIYNLSKAIIIDQPHPITHSAVKRIDHNLSLASINYSVGHESYLHAIQYHYVESEAFVS